MKINISERNNFFYFLISILIVLSSPVIYEISNSYFIFNISTTLGFLICILSVRFNTRFIMILTICLGSWIALGILKFFWMSHEFVIDLLKLSISTIFFSFIFSLAARQVLFSGHVDLNKIVGSLSLFLVLGLIWSFLYLIILKLDSDSFSGICLQSQNTDFSNATYFSFVTLTTLGYGDITPRSSLAKLLVYLESAVGIFYMSVVVSSLVGASLNKKQIDI